MKNSNFKFYILKDKNINAFALPGGYIYVNNGLIYATMSENELASVLAHEISHVVQHHVFRNLAIYNRNQYLAIGGIIAAALMTGFNPGVAALSLAGSQGLALQNMLTFSRDSEREADRMGQNLMAQAGFDPQAMPQFFQTLATNNKFNENSALGFLQTHPLTNERIAEAQIRNYNYKIKMRVDSINFLLIREKTRLRQIGVENCINFYHSTLKNGNYISRDAQYYGMAWANYNKNTSAGYLNAHNYLNKIQNHAYKNNPIILEFYAQLLLSENNYIQLDKFYKQVLKIYPTYQGLWLGQLNYYQKTTQYKILLTRIKKLLLNYPDNLELWNFMAQTCADNALNQIKEYHYALATIYFLKQNYQMSLKEYQLALDSKPRNIYLDSLIKEKLNSIHQL